MTTGKAVLRKVLQEIQPVEQTTFSHGSNQIMTFNVSSNRDFISLPESYFKASFQIDANHNAAQGFDVGGVSSLFRSVEIRSLASGILLQRYDYYNRYAAIKSLVKENEGMSEDRWNYGDGGYDAVNPGTLVPLTSRNDGRRLFLAASATNQTITWKIDHVSLAQHVLPLFLMKGGIEIRFELEHPSRAIFDNRAPSTTGAAVTYAIASPRMMAMMVTPHGDIVDEYVRQWKGEGLLYSIPSVRSKRVTSVTDASGDVIQMHFGVRQGRKVYLVQQDSALSDGTGALTSASQSLSLFVRGLVSEYQVKVGSQEYPLRPVNVDVDAAEAFEQLKITAMNREMRLSANEYRSINTVYTDTSDNTVAAESLHFIIGIDLSRDNGPNSNLTGTDLSVVPLDFDYDRSAAYDSPSNNLPGTPIWYAFCEHDSYLLLSESQVAVMN
jgi:hypothetical protein